MARTIEYSMQINANVVEDGKIVGVLYQKTYGLTKPQADNICYNVEHAYEEPVNESSESEVVPDNDIN